MGGEGRGASDYFRICQLSHSSAYPASLSPCLRASCFLYSAPSTTTNVERPMPIEVHWKFSIIAFLTFDLRQKFSNRWLARNQTISKLKLDKNDQLNLADQSLNIDVDISKNVKFNFCSELWFNIILALLQRSSGMKK